MAQIIKHRRGSITQIASVTANVGELVMATGSVGDLTAPVLFIGESAVAGGYKPVSKIYQGSEAPNLTSNTWGTALNGTPFYSTVSQSLQILNNAGNTVMDLSGNLEGTTISSLTVTNITGTTANFDTINLGSIAFTGLTANRLALVGAGGTIVDSPNFTYSGNTLTISGVTDVLGDVNITNNLAITGTTSISGATTIDDTIRVTGNSSLEGNLNVTGTTSISGATTIDNTLDVNSQATLSSANVEDLTNNRIVIAGNNGELEDDANFTFDGTTFKVGDGDFEVTVANGNTRTSGSLLVQGVTTLNDNANIDGNVTVTGSLVVTNAAGLFSASLVAENSNLTLTSGSNLSVENGGTATFNGNATFQSGVFITGLTDNRILIAGAGGKVEDDGNLTFNGTTFKIGDGSFEVDSNTGNLRTSGSITMKGNITIGDNLTGDTINVNGQISSSLVPSGSNVFDLGSPSNAWKDLYVSGTAYVENINIGQVSLINLALPGNLTVSGTTILSGSVLVEDLTQKRLVVAGTNGQLVDYSGLTFDNGNLNLSGALEVTNIQGTGSLYLKPDLNDSRDFRIYNTAPSDIHFKGSATYNFFGDDTNFLKIDDSLNDITIESLSGVTVNTTLKVTGNSSLEGNLDVTGTTTLNSSTYVTGLTDNRIVIAGVGGLLEDDANFTFDGSTFKIGDGQFEVDVNDGDIRTSGSFEVGNGITINGNQTVNGTLTVTGTTELKGNVGINSSLDVTGSATFKNNISVSGTTTLSGDTYVEYLTDNRVLLAGPSGKIEDDANLTFDGTTLKVGNGQVEIDNADGDIRSSGSLSIAKITDIGGNDLSIDVAGDLFLSSSTALNVQINVGNEEGSNNILAVDRYGIELKTHDTGSGLDHIVFLDNTGSLKLTNVDLKVSGSLNVNSNSTFDNDLTVKGNMYVSGNFQVLGTGSIISLTGSQIDIGTNKISLNTYAPFERFAGIDVYDSGSNVGVTGSLLWDSQNNVWIYANPSGSAYASARFIAGPKNTGSLGEETGLSIGHFPIAVDDDHIADSLLTYIGTTLALNTNKFTVDSGTGDTLINGNLTIKGVGAVNASGYTSYVVFKNDSTDDLGFVTSTDTLNVTDRLLGYNASTGVLEFSSLIDGGTY